MLKKSLLLFITCCLLSAFPALAGNNLIVTCNPTSSNSGTCEVSPPDKSLFSETDVKPGYNIYQKLTVVNQSVDDDCTLYLKASNKTDLSGLATVLHNIISKNNLTLYSQLMSTLFGAADPVYLDTVPRSSTVAYDWKLIMDTNANNDYQNKHLEFDLSLTFQCGQEPTDTSGAAPTSTPTPDTTCHDQIPGTPTITALSHSPGSSNAHLYWTPPSSPFTGYVLAYGPDRDTFWYGNPGIPVNTDDYVIGSLNPNGIYCFRIRAQNGCASGEYSNVRCFNNETAGSVTIAPTPLPSFSPGILGENISAPAALGAVTATCSRFWIPLLFLFALLFNFIYILRNTGLKKSIIPALVSLTAFLVDSYLLRSRCCLLSPLICQYYWLGPLFSYLLPRFLLH